MASPISGVNVIVAVGSVDGIASAAACIHHEKNQSIQVVFTQAFEVYKVDVKKWPENSVVGFIDLGVNNEGRTPNPTITEDFVRAIYAQGHRIKFIADEHDKAAWDAVLEKCGHTRSELTIAPQDRAEYSSSSAILLEALKETADDHTKALLHDGDQGDRMNFDTPFGRIFNTAIKSNMADPARRPYLAKYMAEHSDADETISGWMKEYAEIQANQPKILASRQDLGDGISLYDGTLGRHDATALFLEAYKTSSYVVLVSQVGVSIATNQAMNVLDIIQKAGITAGGMAAKANLAVADKDAAIAALRGALAPKAAVADEARVVTV